MNRRLLQGLKRAAPQSGHELRDVGRTYGNMQLIRQAEESGRITGASDPRGIGSTGVIEAAGSE